MKNSYPTLFSLCFFLLHFQAFSQAIGGTKTICTSGCDYATLNAAVTALNTNGVASGGVVFEVANGHTETIPLGGYLLGSSTLNASLNANNHLVIRKTSTSGLKPVFTSGVGSGTMDAMFLMLGTDYVTLENLVFNESSGNSTPTFRMEYGIMMVKKNVTAPLDGCQNNVIRNCEVSFIQGGSVINIGIYGGNHVYNSITSLVPTSITDANSFNTITSNQINNAQTGISFSGYVQGSPFNLMDQGNVIGLVGQGNALNRIGSNLAVGAGIFISNQRNTLIRSNLIGGGNISSNFNLSGIWAQHCQSLHIYGNTIRDTINWGLNAGIYCTYITNGQLIIDSNIIAGSLTGTGEFVGISSNSSDSVFISRNLVESNFTLVYSIYRNNGIFYNGETGKFMLIQNNIIRNNLNNCGFNGIRLTGIGNNHKVFNNEIYLNTSMTGNLSGISNDVNAAATDSIIGNQIYDLYNTGIGNVFGYNRSNTGPNYDGTKVVERNKIYRLHVKSGSLKAIYHGNSRGPIWIKSNEIFGLYSDSSNCNLSGIEIGNSATQVNIINNAISEMSTFFSLSVSYIQGIYLNNATVGNFCRVYNNTVSLNALTSGHLISSCVRSNTNSDIELQNNILVNRSLAIINGLASAFYREGANLSTYRPASNYNLFYASGTPGRAALYTDGILKDTTLASYKSRMINRDQNSYQENLIFSNTVASPYQLFPIAGVLTQVESGGNRIDTPFTVYTDILGNPRSMRYPDLGCYEGTYLLLDTVKPTVKCNPVLGASSFAQAPIIEASIFDRFGINTLPTFRPRLYFKKKTDANTFISNSPLVGGWKYVLTNDTVNLFKYEVDFSLLNSSIVLGDTIQFFVVAQDSNNNIGAGQIGFNVWPTSTALGASAFPINGNLSIFPILDTLSGIYSVGTGGNFNSLTQAFSKLQNSVLKGPVELRLINNYYRSVSNGGLENFPLRLYPAAGMSAVNSLTIKPATGVNALIFGNADTALLIIQDGVKNVIINGSNNGSNTRNLGLTNGNPSGLSVIQFQGTAIVGGIKEVSLINLIIKGGSTSVTHNILIGTTANGAPNLIGKTLGISQINISNCHLYNGLSGIIAIGKNDSPINRLRIGNNIIGSDTLGMSIGWLGTYLEGNQFTIFENNRIYNLETNASRVLTAIQLGEGVIHSVIKNNYINNLNATNVSNSGSCGILISSDINVINDSIYNNSISQILSPNNGLSASTVNGAFGIKIVGGKQIKIFYNSVHLSGVSTFGTSTNASSAMLIVGNANFEGLEIRNNSFSNIISNAVVGSRQVAFWCEPNLQLLPSIQNYNNFYTQGATSILWYYMNNNYNTLSQVQSLSGTNANSIQSNPRYLNNSFLIPVLKGGFKIGQPITTIVRDILDSVRSSSLTRIGCYEFDCDIESPQFGYYKTFAGTGASPLVNLSLLEIQDSLSGLDLKPGNKPRVYYKKKTENDAFGANNSSFNGWKWIECSNDVSPYQFNLDYSLLTSLPALNDSIYYFFVAQDSVGNASRLPAAGGNLGSVGNVSAPTFPYRYKVIIAPLAGNYLVGVGGNYPTITAAVADLNLRGVSAPVNFLLTNTSYTNATETFPIQFNSNVYGLSKTNAFTLRPNNGVQSTISAISSAAIFILNGTSFINISGADTLLPNSRNLTLRNGILVVALQNDASFNSIKNCILQGSGTAINSGIVKFGNRFQFGNDSNTIDNCWIGNFSTSYPATLIEATATTGPLTAITEGNKIINCELVNMGNYGIYAYGYNCGFFISGNSFYRSALFQNTNNFAFVYLNDSAIGSSIIGNYFGGISANCGGSGSTVVSDLGGSFSFSAIKINGFNVRCLIKNNIFQKITYNVAQGTHYIIYGNSNKGEISGNLIGADTGLASIQFNLTSTVGFSYKFNVLSFGNFDTQSDTFFITNNRIGSVQANGNRNMDVNLIIGGIDGNVEISNNYLGSGTQYRSINLNTPAIQSSLGHLYGIHCFGAFNPNSIFNIYNNTINNLAISNNSNPGNLYGIYCGSDGKILVENNKIHNLYFAPIVRNNVDVGGIIYGIYYTNSSVGNAIINKNSLQNFVSKNDKAFAATGIYAQNTSPSGKVVVSRNSIFALYADSGSRIYTGIEVYGQSILVTHNSVSLGTDTLGNFIRAATEFNGIKLTTFQNNKIFFNSVSIKGTGVDLLPFGFSSAAFHSLTYTFADSIYNNIFYNTRSNSSTSPLYGTHSALRFSGPASTIPYCDKNLLYVNGNNGHITLLNTTKYTTLQSWSTVNLRDLQSRSKVVSFTSVGNLRLTSPSIGDTALIGLPRAALGPDIDNETRDWKKPYMGCDDVISSPLPVTLINFEAKANNLDALLYWQTASEQNNKGFWVTRSLDGENFEKIAFLKGIGNSSQTLNYQFVDASILGKAVVIYYQLLQEDFNGLLTKSETKIVELETPTNSSVKYYPNPITDKLNIQLNQGSILLGATLFSIDGKDLGSPTIKQINSMASEFEIDFQNYTFGIYILSLKFSNGVQYLRLIKE